MNKLYKVISAVLVTFLVIGFVPQFIKADEDIRVVIDGTEIWFDVKPAIINDRVMVPISRLAAVLEASVDWNGVTKDVLLIYQNKYILFTVGYTKMIFGSVDDLKNESGRFLTLDSPPVIVDDRTFVPLRAISEGLGATVSYDGNTRTVYINMSGDPIIIPESPEPVETPEPEVSTDPQQLVNEILYYCNLERINAGLEAFNIWYEPLFLAAQIRVSEIMVNFSTIRPDGSDFKTVFDEAEVNRTLVGECIARNISDPEELVKMLMNYEETRKNIVDPAYNYLGVAVMISQEGAYYWVLTFCE